MYNCVNNEIPVVKWELDENVICEEIHNIYILISAQGEKPIHPFVQQINEYGAFCWKNLEKEKDLYKVIHAITKRFDISENEAWENLLPFLKALQEKQYLTLTYE